MQAVIERSPIATGSLESNMVPYFLCDCRWIFAKVTGNLLKSFLFF